MSFIHVSPQKRRALAQKIECLERKAEREPTWLLAEVYRKKAQEARDKLDA